MSHYTATRTALSAIEDTPAISKNDSSRKVVSPSSGETSCMFFNYFEIRDYSPSHSLIGAPRIEIDAVTPRQEDSNMTDISTHDVGEGTFFYLFQSQVRLFIITFSNRCTSH